MYRRRELLLEDGTPCWGLNVEHIVTKVTFAKLLADDHWEGTKEFNPKMPKSDGMKLLRSRLSFMGNQGIDKERWEGASQEFAQPWEDAYAAALEWIEKHFPYLK